MKSRNRRRNLRWPRRFEERMEVAKLIVQMAPDATVRNAVLPRADWQMAATWPIRPRAARMAAACNCGQQNRGDSEETIEHRLLASA